MFNMQKAVRCSKCDKYFVFTKRDIDCPFCHTRYGKARELLKEEREKEEALKEKEALKEEKARKKEEKTKGKKLTVKSEKESSKFSKDA